MSDNRRIAKNTLILYMRMIITLAIGVWTSRIVLNALGFTDQGLYNLVGGFVGMLSVVSSSVTGSISRFITFEIGKGDKTQINLAYRNSCFVEVILSAIIILLAETIGLWFLNNKLVIPADKLADVRIVYQLSLATFILGILSISQVALVIAYEKMNVYAYVSIASKLIQLGIAFAIMYSDSDKLVIYAVLQFALSLGSRIFYACYIRARFPFCKYGFNHSKKFFKPIFNFAGWNMFGSVADVLRTSGNGILLNLFGGPIANTINGIANQANSLATIFVGDFTTAYSPQITKEYARGSYADLIPFIWRCSKFSFCLLAIIAIPLIVNMDSLLILWLKKIPDGTAVFAQIIIINSLIECMSRPMIIAKNATGKIRNYQIIVGGILLLTLPISYLFFKLNFPLYFAYIAVTITSGGAFIARMIVLRGDLPGWSSSRYIFKVFSRCLLAFGISFLIAFAIHNALPDTIPSVLVQSVIVALITAIVVLFFVCSRGERQIIRNFAYKTFSKIKGVSSRYYS